MNVGSFICSMMVVAQIMGSLFGFGSVSVQDLFGIKPALAGEGIARMINYQGRLMNDLGEDVTNGNYDMIFVIYDSATGGNQLWSASTTNGLPTGTTSTVSVAVKNGLFSILLGDTDSGQVAFPEHLYNIDNLYLGVTISSDSEMVPRKRLSSVPYAFNAETLQGQYASGTSLGSDGNLFALNQASSTTAYATRTALFIQTQGTSNLWDFLLRANNSVSDVFTITRQGNVTTTGNLYVAGTTVFGSASSSPAIFNSYINSDFIPYTDNVYSLGSLDYRWKNLNAVNVSSTNIDALGYVSTTNLYINGAPVDLSNRFVQNGNSFGAGAVLGTNDNYSLSFETNNVTWATFGTNGQFSLTGPADTGVNASGYKLYISEYDNDDASYTYPIYLIDENGRVDFYLRSRSTEAGNSLAFFQGDVQIGNTIDSNDHFLTVTGLKDAGINLIADTNNADETDNPYVNFTRAGGSIQAIMGIVGDSGRDPLNNLYTGTLLNSFFIGQKQARALQFGTNNTVRQTISADGNVGMGTIDPQFPLHISKTSTNKDVLLIQETTGGIGNSANIAFKTNAGNGTDSLMARIRAYDRGSWNADLIFEVSGDNLQNILTTEAMRIAYTGNVGIGDSSPSNLFSVGSGGLFQVDSNGNIVKIRNLTYSFPNTQGGVNTYLTNDGSGNLTWQANPGVMATPTWQDVTDSGAETSHWIMFAGASSTGNVNPSAHNEYDLGTSYSAWRNLYVSSSAYINNVVTNQISFNNVSTTNFDSANYVSTTNLFSYSSYLTNVTTTNIYNSGTVSTTELYVNGVQVTGIESQDLQAVTDIGAITTNRIQFAGATSAGDILPLNNLTYDLGSSNNRWNDIWASSTRIGTSTWELWQSNEGFTISTNNLADKYLILSNSGALLPGSHDTQDIGSVTNGWRNLYISNRIYAHSMDITPDSNWITEVTSTNIASAGGMRGIDVVGDYAYITDINSAEMHVYDVSNPADPKMVGSVNLTTGNDLVEDSLGTIIVQGDYAYIYYMNRELYGVTNGHVVVVDISNPANPTRVGQSVSLTATNFSYDLDVQGNYVYFADNQNSQLDIIDVTVPTNPTLVKTVSVTAPHAVVVSGKYAYTVPEQTTNDPVSVVDISDPPNAFLVGTVNSMSAGYPVDMAISKNALFIHDSSELIAMDISNPSAPVLKDDISSSGGLIRMPQSIIATGDYVYTFTGSALVIFDVSDLTDLKLIAQISMGATPTPWSLDIEGKYAYIVDSNRNLRIFDIGGVETHALTAHSAYVNKLSVSDSAIFANGASINGKLTVGKEGIYNQGFFDNLGTSRFYATSTFADIQVNGRVNSNLLPYSTLTYDLGSSAYRWKDAWASTVRIGTSTWELWQSNDGFVISTNNLATKYFTITNSGNLLSASNNTQDIGSASNAWRNIYAGDTVTSPNYWGRRINANNPTDTSVSQLAVVNLGAACYGAGALQGNYYYHTCGAGSSYMHIVDVSNSANPLYVVNLDLSVNAYSMKVKGKYAYAGNASGDIAVIDVSNISSPNIVNTLDAGANQIVFHEVSGNYLYYPDSVTGDLEIYDISDPVNASSVPVGSVSTQGSSPMMVAVQGDYAYVANYLDDSVSVINIANPTNPTLVSKTSALTRPTSVSVQGRYLYVAHDTSDLLAVFDIKNPFNPILIGSVNWGGNTDASYAQNIIVQGRYSYLLKSGGGLAIVDISSSTNPLVVATSPTTANGIGGIAVSGKYIYTNTFNGSTFIVHDMGGVDVNGLVADSAQLGNLQVLGSANIGGWLDVQGGLQIGVHGLNSLGKITGQSDLYIKGNSFLNNVYSNQHNTYNLGSASNRWKTLYTTNLDARKIVVSPVTPEVLYSLNNSASRDGVTAVKIIGKHLYLGVADNISGLGVAGQDFQILDLANNSQPTYVGGLELSGGTVRDIEIIGDYAYLGGLNMTASGYEILIVNISNLGSPQTVYGIDLDTTNEVSDLLVVENYLYASTNGGAGGNEVLIYDITNPAELSYKTGIDLGTNAANNTYSLDLFKDGYLVIGGMNSDIYTDKDIFIFNITNPLNPTYVGGVDITSGYVKTVKVRGTYIYAGTDNNGSGNNEFFIINAASMAAPVVAGSLNMGTSYVEDISFANDYVYLSQNNGYNGNEISVINISSSTNPEYTAGIDIGTNDSVNKIDISGNILVLGVLGNTGSDLNDLYIMDIGGIKSHAASFGALSADQFNIYRDGRIGHNLYVKNDIYAEHINAQYYTGYNYKGTNAFFNNLGTYNLNITPKTPEWITGLDTGTQPINTVVVHGKLAFIGTLNSTYGPRTTDDLQIIDISHSSNIQFIGGIDVGAAVDKVVVRGDFAYVMRRANSENLRIYNISNPYNPTYVGGLTLYTGANYDTNALDVVGNYAYVGVNGGASESELKVVDVSDASNPKLIGQFNITANEGNHFHTLKVVDNIVYAGVTNASLYSNQDLILINVANPYSPAYLGGYNVGTNGVVDINVIGSRAYLATTDGTTGSHDLAIIDCSVPATLQYLGGVNLSAGITGLDVVENYAYVTSLNGYNTNNDLMVVDISNPASPSVLTGLDLQVSSIANVDISGGLGFVAANNSGYQSTNADFIVLDLGGMRAFAADIGTLSVNQLDVGSDATFGNNVSVAGTLSVGEFGIKSLGSLSVATSSWFYGLMQTVNIRPLTNVTYDLGDPSFQWRNTYTEQLTALPTALQQMATITPTGDIRNIEVQGKYLYVLDNYNSFKIYDVYNPSSPALISTLALAGDPYTMVVSGNFAYLARSNTAGIQVVDISDPKNPVLRSTLTAGVPAYSYDAYVSGKYLYVSYGGSADGVYIYNIENPDNVTIVGNTAPFTGDARGVAVSGKFLYVAEMGTDSLHVFDVANPASPVFKGAIDFGTIDPTDVVIKGNYAYVADASFIRIVDVSNPAVPVLKSSLAAAGTHALYIADNYLYAGGTSLFTIDVSNPSAPFIVNTVASLTTIHDIEVSGRALYTARTNTDEIRIFDIKGAYINGLAANSATIGSLQVMTDARFNNKVDISGGLTVGNRGIYTNGTLSVLDNSILLGNVGIGTSYPNNFKLQIAGNIGPETNDAYDLGSGARRFKDAYFSGTVETKPATITKLGGINVGATVLSTVIRGDYLYVGMDDETLTGNSEDFQIYDIKDPNNPKYIAGVNSQPGAGVKDIIIKGRYAYINGNTNNSSGNPGLWIYDISNPNNITLMNTIYTGQNGAYTNMAYRDEYVYMVAANSFGNQKLFIYDVSNPTSIVLTNTYDFGTGSNESAEVYVNGRYLYVAGESFPNNGNNDFLIFDLADPINPVYLGGTDVNTVLIRSIHAVGNYVYLGTSSSNDDIWVIDASSSTNPVVQGSIGVGLNAVTSIILADNYLIGGTRDGPSNNDIVVYDVSSSTSLSYVTGVNNITGDSINSLALNGKVLVVGTLNASGGTHDIELYNFGGIKSQSADIGSIRTNLLRVSEDLHVGNNLFVANGIYSDYGGIHTMGALSVRSTSTLSDLEVTGRVNSHLLPYIDDTYDLGNATYRWRNLNAVNATFTSLYVANGYQTNAFIQHGNGFGEAAVLGTNDDYNLNFETNNITRLTLDTAGNLYPATDNTQQFGTITNRWSDVWSGTLRVGTGDWVIRETAGDAFSIQYNFEQYLGIEKNTTNNIWLGYNAGLYNQLGTANVAIGSGAVGRIEDGLEVTAVGHNAYRTFLEGNYNTALGSKALYGSNGDQIAHYNTGIGAYSLYGLNTGASNTAVGFESLYSNTDGFYNVGIGLRNMYSNTTGAANTAIGALALQANQTGSFNTALGATALFNNINGNDNIAIGYNALFNNTVDNNTALGKNSLYSNTTGEYNIAVGPNALHTHTNGFYNIAIGESSSYYLASGNDNTAVGDQSMLGFLGGNFNTAIGAKALKGVDYGSTASHNTGIGAYSLHTLSTGASNTAVGYGSLFSNEAGYRNTALGTMSLSSNVDGFSNVAIGHQALQYATSSLYSIAIGDRAGLYDYGNFNIAIGYQALSHNNYTQNNIGIGFEALYRNNSGKNNVIIGPQAGRNIASDNNVALGGLSLYGGVSYATGQANTAIGNLSIFAITTGSTNTAVGINSLFMNSSGSYNSVLGGEAMLNNTTGLSNTAVGFDSLYSNQTGNYNIAVGAGSLYSNTTSSNMGIGNGAGYGLTVGSYNIAMGQNAMVGNQTGNFNTLVGYESGKGVWGQDNSWNTGLGAHSLYSITTGNYNTALGVEALYSNNSGSSNIAIGSGALKSNTDGTLNIGIGNGALGSLDGGTGNVGVGFGALYNYNDDAATAVGYAALYFAGITDRHNTALGYLAAYHTGYNATEVTHNTAVGNKALYTNRSGIGNTALGSEALYLGTDISDRTAVGRAALYTGGSTGATAIGSSAGLSLLSTGEYFTAVGTAAGLNTTSGDWNTFVGYYAGYENTVGGVNTAIGSHAIYKNTSGGYNTGLGQGALFSMNGGMYNTALGAHSGFYVTSTASYNTSVGFRSLYGSASLGSSGGYNTAIGSNVLEVNTTGHRNVAVGAVALTSNTTGYYNNAVGTDAMQRNTEGHSNNAMGFEAMYWNQTGVYNTALGHQALKGTSGYNFSYNTAVGALALDDITNAAGNSAFGYGALSAVSSGGYNSGFGYSVFSSLTTGTGNSALGNQAGLYNVTGSYNVAIGHYALLGTSGNSHSHNTAVGTYALQYAGSGSDGNVAVGYGSLSNSSMSGDYNVGVGYNAGNGITSGNYNTLIGYDADVSTASISNATAIGYGSRVGSSDTVRVGNTSVLSIGGYQPWSDLSDARLKQNVVDTDLGLDFINKLRPVKFEFIHSPGIMNDGFIAQEVKSAMDQLGKSFSGLDDHEFNQGGYYYLEYGTFVTPLVRAVQQISASSSMLWNGIEVDPSFASLGESFLSVDLDGNLMHKGSTIKAQNIASSSTQAFGSYTFSFMGSAWNPETSQEITTSFRLQNNTISATSSEFNLIFATGTAFGQSILTITDLGDVKTTGDLYVGKRLFLGSKTTGGSSTSTYIFVDDTLGEGATYIATNADGWQADTSYDYAERYQSSDLLEPGDLVIADKEGINKVKRSTSSQDIVLGIVSTKPGFITGGPEPDSYPIALAGRVPTKVSTINGAIQVGDFLSPSDIPGVAVKSIGKGSVIGVALESYDLPQEGLISVFVNVGYMGNKFALNDASESSSQDIKGFAFMKAGSQEVKVSHESVLAYPIVQLFPQGYVNGSYSVKDVTTSGFIIKFSNPQDLDIKISYIVTVPNTDSLHVSDGTVSTLDSEIGEPIGPTLDDLIITNESEDEEQTDTAVSDPEQATSSTTMVSSTDTQETDTAVSSAEPVVGGDTVVSGS
jgi:hypothetical protein